MCSMPVPLMIAQDVMSGYSHVLRPLRITYVTLRLFLCLYNHFIVYTKQDKKANGLT